MKKKRINKNVGLYITDEELKAIEERVKKRKGEMMKKKTKKISKNTSLYVTAEQLERIEERVEELDISLSKFVTKAVIAALDGEDELVDALEKIERLASGEKNDSDVC